MKYDKSHRIIEEPGLLMRIINLFRDKCEKCGKYASHVARFIPKCESCWEAGCREYFREERKREEREIRRKARIFVEELNRR